MVYEAGPTGFGLYRELRRHGYHCEIVAPSLIPRRTGDRLKNDRRDCCRLPELSRSGELKAIWVPDEAHEAVRDLCQAREDAVQMRLRSRQQFKAFLLRHDRRYFGKTSWTKTHERWIADQRFDHAGQSIALAEYQSTGRSGRQAARGAVERLTTTRARGGGAAQPGRYRQRQRHWPDCEIGDFSRFKSARDLMG